MKRRPPIVVILLFVVAGAIVNVVVAWGLATWTIEIKATDTSFTRPIQWLGSAPDRWPEPMAGGHVAGIGRRKEIRSGIGPGVTGKPSFFHEEVLQTGLPMRGLQFSSRLSYEKDQVTSHWGYVHALNGRAIGLPDRQLPLKPIWPGFAINTVFYAFILWLLFAAPFALRRRRRIKRGLCPKCAYPRGAGTNQVCTECGAAVSPSPLGRGRAVG